MFCDLVGSTAISEKLGTEGFAELLHLYRGVCEEAVRSVDGWIAQLFGDGVLVYFGFPRAHEDDAFRALTAALRIRRGLAAERSRIVQRFPDLGRQQVTVRVGIHTGDVVVGPQDSTSQGETLALGDTVNIASRLQRRAAAEEILLSGATRRLVGKAFQFEDLGAHALRGITKSVRIHRLLGSQGSPESSDPRLTPFPTPLVGRFQELSLLMDRWESATDGQGQAVLLMGEPGIGKSRLVFELRQRLAGTSHRWFSCHASADRQATPFDPLLRLIEKRLGIWQRDSSMVRRNKIDAGLQQASLPTHELVPIFEMMLSRTPSEGQPASFLPPDNVRHRFMEAVVALLLSSESASPTVIVMEDLQWIDPSSLQVLDMILREVATRRVLIVLTARSMFRSPWTEHPLLAHLTLSPITRKQTESMVGSLTQGFALPEEVLATIVSRADGVPLFVEELTRSLLESGLLRRIGDRYEVCGTISRLAIPSTLQASLTARLDRLEEAKEVAQLGSVVGREFTLDLLAACSGRDPGELERDAHRLAASGLVWRKGAGETARWVFKHSLVQESAYHSLLSTTRRQLHARIASILETDSSHRWDAVPEVIAHHFDEAHLAEDAIRQYQLAADRAADRSADAEALAHLGRAIELVKELADTPERATRELRLRVSFGVLKMASAGSADPVVEDGFFRVQTLCRQLGDGRETSHALFGLAVFHQARGEIQAALELGETLLARADRSEDVSVRVSAHLSLGAALFWSNQPRRALDHLERAASLYDSNRDRALAYVYGQDPAVASRAYGAMALWQLGRPDQALTWAHTAIELARDDRSRALALTFAAIVHWMRREPGLVQALSADVIAIARKRSLVLWLGAGLVLRGWALTGTALRSESLETVESGLMQLRSAGTAVAAPLVFLLRAETQRAGELPQQALESLQAAHEFVAGRHSPLLEAELIRLRGEIELEQGRLDEAGTLFQDALVLAEKQGALSLALRAAISCARLQLQRGDPGEARTLLARIRARFDEGFGTLDLRDADALLTRLACRG